MAALSNELQVGVGDYAISESDTATTVTLYSHQTRDYATAHLVSDDLTVGTLGTVIAHSSTERSDTFDSDFTDILGKYIKSGVSWYKVKTKPTKTATNEAIVNGASDEITLFVTGNPDSKFSLTIGSGISASGGEIVLANRKTIQKSYNDSFSGDVTGKIILLSSNYYSVTAINKYHSSTSETVDGQIRRLTYIYGANANDVLPYATGWSYDSSGAGYISNNYEIDMRDYDSSSIDSLFSTLSGTYRTITYQAWDEYAEKLVTYTNPYKYYSYRTYEENGITLVEVAYQEVTKAPVSSFTVKGILMAQSHSADSYSITVPGYLVSSAISGCKYTFTNEEIVTLEGEKAVAVDGDELSIDTLTPVIEYEYFERLIFKPTDYTGIQTTDSLIFCGHFNDDISELTYGSPIKYYNDGNNMGTFYAKSVIQKEEKKYQINGMSFIGLLDKRYHVGGVYVAVRFDTILGEILTDLTDITIQDEVAATTLTGYLPYDTARNNLHQLLFATGAVILRSDDGKLVFSYLLPDASTSVINTNNIFDDGEVEYLTPCSKIELTEYSYKLLDDTELDTVYSNVEEATVTNKKVIFNTAPVDPSTFAVSNGYALVKLDTFATKISTTGTFTFLYDGTNWYYNSEIVTLEDYGIEVDDTLAAANTVTVTITSTSKGISANTTSSTDSFSYDTSKCNCNYAYVTGRGALLAKPYTQSTQIIEKDNSEAQEDYQENVVSSSDVTLISAANSDNVSNRLLKYYKALKNEKITIKVTNETCGNKYGFKNAFRKYSTGYLTKMSYQLSSFIKANCEFLVDYTPDNMGNDYSKSVILTKEDERASSGVWTSPKTGTIRAILIAGGNGGSSGFAGSGSTGDGYGGEGGAAGTRGNGGKILNVASISVTQGQQISFHIGSGCTGGAACDSHITCNLPANTEVVHQAGDGKTTFGDYTTDCSDAHVSSTGVLDVFTGKVYALPGSTGAAGGNGGAAAGANTMTSTSGSAYSYSRGKSQSGDAVVYKGTTTLGGSGVYNITPEEIINALENGNDGYAVLSLDNYWSTPATIPSTGGGGASAGNPGGQGYSAKNQLLKATMENYEKLTESTTTSTSTTTGQDPAFEYDVYKYATANDFPYYGVAGGIYVALDTGKYYECDGSQYVKINDSGSSIGTVTATKTEVQTSQGIVMHLYVNAYTTYGLTGKGSDGIARGTAETYGSGGAAGHGGGGEGGAPDTSYDSQELENYSDQANVIQANLYISRPIYFGNRYGKGGAGGNGADGCILLYL